MTQLSGYRNGSWVLRVLALASYATQGGSPKGGDRSNDMFAPEARHGIGQTSGLPIMKFLNGRKCFKETGLKK